MPVRIANVNNIAPINLTGRDLTWLVTRDSVGAEKLSIAIMYCFPYSVVRPMHAHRDIEEVILILGGQGEAWVDGDRAAFKEGDAVLFPANSKHQVRNTGALPLRTASIFSAPTRPEDYVIYDEDAFAGLDGCTPDNVEQGWP
jgi:mannose-6-phosphate isomerase-like protein (cupin superfamily)